MGRAESAGCRTAGKALNEYVKGNFAKCEHLLLGCYKGCEVCTEYLARFYYEMGSPFRAAAILNSQGREMEATLYLSLTEEGELVSKEGERKHILRAALMNAHIREDGYMLPLDEKLLDKLLKEYEGLIPEKILKEAEEIRRYGKRTS